jgi:hypothetical protein
VKLMGQAQADGAGAWAIRSSVLADGRYVITAAATDEFHETTATALILPAQASGQDPLVIDTAAPRVTALAFRPAAGQIDLTFQDGLAGLDPARLADAVSYALTRVGSRGGSYPVDAVAAIPDGPPGAAHVILTIGTGRRLQPGVYTLTVRAGAGATGVRDLAGNPLDGEFYGTFPSGNGSPGGSFVAQLDTRHRRVLAPQTVIGKAHPLPRATTSIRAPAAARALARGMNRPIEPRRSNHGTHRTGSDENIASSHFFRVFRMFRG